MRVKIENIKVRHRIRKDLGDLEPLRESLKRLGQIEPIVVNEKNELVAGQRRLEAARQLGWTHIEAHVADIDDPLKLLDVELEENVQRMPFSEQELHEGYVRLERFRHPFFLVKIWNAIKAFFLNLFQKIFGKKRKF